MESGQCHCRRHLIGRQCSEVQPGYFCAPLDYYKYEAEDATGHSPGDSALPVSGPELQGQAQGQCPSPPTRPWQPVFLRKWLQEVADWNNSVVSDRDSRASVPSSSSPRLTCLLNTRRRIREVGAEGKCCRLLSESAEVVPPSASRSQ